MMETESAGTFCAVGVDKESATCALKGQTLTNKDILELFPQSRSFKESYEIAIRDNALFQKLAYGVDTKGLQTKVSRVEADFKNLKRNKIIKKNKQVLNLHDFEQGPFNFPISRSKNVCDDDVKSEKLNTLLSKTKHVVIENRSLKRELAEVEESHDVLSTQILRYESKVNILLSLLDVVTHKYKDSLSEIKSVDKVKKECSAWERKYDKLSEKLDETVGKLKEKRERMNDVTRNMAKKMKRRKEKIEATSTIMRDQDEKIETLSTTVEEMKDEVCMKQRKVDELKRDKRSLLVKICRLKKGGNLNVSDDVSDEIKSLKLEIKEKESRILELEQLNTLLDSPIIESFQDGKYISEVRETIMSLVTEFGVSQKKVNGVIQTVLANLAGKQLSSLPSTGVKSRLLIEAKRIAQMQVKEEMLKSRPGEMTGNCLHQDGTSKFHRHFQSFQLTTPEMKTYSLGLSEVGSADANTLMTTFKGLLSDLSTSIQGKSDENKVQQLVSTIVATMSDQGATNPVFNRQLLEYKQSIMPYVVENWDTIDQSLKSEMCNISSFFCKMHIFINMASEVDKCLAVFEKTVSEGKNPFSFDWKESGGARLTRCVSKALTMGGCEKSGVGGHFSTFLKDKDKKNLLISYRGHRFNHLFYVAGAVYHHRNDIIEFLGTWSDPNDLLKNVAFDIRELAFCSSIRALGIIDKMITGPFWRLIESVSNVIELTPHLETLKTKLTLFSKDSSSLLAGVPVFPESEVSSTKDSIYDSLFQDCDDPVIDTYTQMALELATGGMLLILERQAKDQLPGGKFYDCPVADQMRGATVSTTNTCSERDFAQLDMLMRLKPSASTECMESIIMWTNNETTQWLSSMSEKQRSEVLDEARKAAPSMMENMKTKRRQLYQKKLEILKKKQEKKVDKENKQYLTKVKLTSKINQVGGLWLSKDDLDRYENTLTEGERNTKMKDAIISQLQFRRQVLGCKGQKEKFQQVVKGKAFSIKELQENLLEIIELNGECEEQIQGELRYKPLEEVNRKLTSEKDKMARKLEEGRQKIKVSQQQSLMPTFIDSPELLVGKSIKHKFIMPESREREWFKGQVTRLAKSDGRKSKYAVEYEGEEGECIYSLLIDMEKGDLICM